MGLVVLESLHEVTSLYQYMLVHLDIPIFWLGAETQQTEERNPTPSWEVFNSLRKGRTFLGLYGDMHKGTNVRFASIEHNRGIANMYIQKASTGKP